MYVSFYKGLGAVAGAALAGDAELVAEARVWQRRQGGNVVTMHPFVVFCRDRARPSASTTHPATWRMRVLWRRRSPRWTDLEVVPTHRRRQCSIVLLRGDGDRLSDAALAVAEERKVFVFGDPSSTTSPSWQRHEVMVGEVSLAIPPEELRDLYAEILERAAG